MNDKLVLKFIDSLCRVFSFKFLMLEPLFNLIRELLFRVYLVLWLIFVYESEVYIAGTKGSITSIIQISASGEERVFFIKNCRFTTHL